MVTLSLVAVEVPVVTLMDRMVRTSDVEEFDVTSMVSGFTYTVQVTVNQMSVISLQVVFAGGDVVVIDDSCPVVWSEVIHPMMDEMVQGLFSWYQK